MTTRIPSDFRSQGDWLAHVRSEFPTGEQSYALALGRARLFRSFYRTQHLPFPAQFAGELERIAALREPARTAALETLNDVIFRSLTKHLFDMVRPAIHEDDMQPLASSRKQIRQLRSYLLATNRFFAVWDVYKRGVGDHSVAVDWDEYLLQELGPCSEEEIEFARAMVELDRLLTLFGDQNLALPSLSFERIWFLYYLRGPERMAQTRAVLGMLTAELAACTSA